MLSRVEQEHQQAGFHEVAGDGFDGGIATGLERFAGIVVEAEHGRNGVGVVRQRMPGLRANGEHVGPRKIHELVAELGDIVRIDAGLEGLHDEVVQRDVVFGRGVVEEFLLEADEVLVRVGVAIGESDVEPGGQAAAQGVRHRGE